MDVMRPLASVSKMVSKGHTVVFAPENEGGSYLLMTNGNWHRLHNREGVYVLPVWMQEEAVSPKEILPSAGMVGMFGTTGFHRHPVGVRPDQ